MMCDGENLGRDGRYGCSYCQNLQLSVMRLLGASFGVLAAIACKFF